MTNMEIIFLGTSSGTPTRDRNPQSILIRRGSNYLLFDAAEGTQKRLIEAGLGLRKDLRIFITHMHGDHCLGLPSILQSYSLMGREEPLEIYGPKGVSEWVVGSIILLHFLPTYPIRISVVGEGTILEEREYSIRALRVNHSVETYAYSLEEKPRPGKFNPNRARELGIPIKLWKRLQMGEKVVVGGRAIDPSEVVSPPRRGRKVVISGDTRPSDRLAEFARGADVLVHEATYSDDLGDRAEETLHSTAREAAEVARRAGVGLLILTHFSARYPDVRGMLKEAREVFPNTIAATDLLRIPVPYPE